MKKTISLILPLILGITFTACTEPEATPDNTTDNNLTSYTMPKDLLTPSEGDKIALIKTNKGNIKVLLYTESAPETTKNFIELSEEGKYNNIIFHRVIKDFMIQTGDFENEDGTGGYSYKGEGTTIKDEFDPKLKHIKGAVSMANRGPDTGGSQFFIVQAEEGTPWLDGAHAVFGYVYEGMETVDEIGNSETINDLPTEEIKIESIEIDTY